MEKETKNITENTEQEENNTNKEQSDKNKKFINKKFYIITGTVLLMFLIVLIFLQENRYNYEKIEDLTEIEEVIINNLVLSYRMDIYDNKSESWECRYLCIFNTGSIYCFDYPENLWIESCYNDESNWKNAENVMYLGQLTEEETERLNQYVVNYDIDNDRYVARDYALPYEYEEPKQGRYTGGSLVRIYWHGEHDMARDIASSGIVYLGFNRYKTDESICTGEENAIAALELVEASGFYDRWVDICLHNG